MIDGTSYRYRPATATDPAPVGRTLEDALTHVLDRLGYLQHCGILVAPDVPLEPQPDGRALLISLSPGTVRVIGTTSLAHEIRACLADGYRGWHTPPPPTTRTPLYELREHLQPAQYNLLERNGFATTEELRDITREAWMELRGAGERFADALRHALNAVPASTPAPTPQGWHLDVDPHGTGATLHLPGPVALTQLSDRILRLLRAPAPFRTATSHDESHNPADDGIWTVDLAEEVLRCAQPSGSLFLRALLDAGGTATADHLREVTGLTALHHATQSLTTNAARILGARYDEGRRWRHIALARRHPERPRDARVHDYHLPENRRAVFDEALRRLGR